MYNSSFSGEPWLRQVSCEWGWFFLSPEQTAGTRSPVEESPTANPSAVAMSVLQLLSVSLSHWLLVIYSPLLVSCWMSPCSPHAWKPGDPVAAPSHTAGNVQFTPQVAFPPHRWLSQPRREGRHQSAPDNLFQRGPLPQSFQHQLLRKVVGEGAQNWLGDTSVQDLHGEWG